MTDQEFFNKVWERAKDPRVASGTGGTCMYRAPDGLRCFVGECIPDAEYDQALRKTPCLISYSMARSRRH